MPRAIWTGAIQFGLVNVPIRMYSAIEEHTLHFNLLHEKDEGRIGYEKIGSQRRTPRRRAAREDEQGRALRPRKAG